MGRFFLIILAFQSFDKINAIIQELFIFDLSIPYWEISSGKSYQHLSARTKACQIMGAISVFCDYMSQFYALWFAVLIQQIIKDPIHRLKKLICFFHTITFIISCSLMIIVSKFNTFGVQVSQLLTLPLNLITKLLLDMSLSISLEKVLRILLLGKSPMWIDVQSWTG